MKTELDAKRALQFKVKWHFGITVLEEKHNMRN